MLQAVTPQWLPHCVMHRIIIHWTAGPRICRPDELDHYHFIVNQDLTIHKGVHGIDENANTADGIYAAHTLKCNQGSIGVSMAGMRGAVESPFDPGPDPITKSQFDRTLALVAQLAVAYQIPVTPQTILTHAEVQDNLKIQQRGKWDITILPWDHTVNSAKEVGDLLRSTVSKIIKENK